MKKLLSKVLIVAFFSLGFHLAAGAQAIYVKVRPVAPVVVRPVSPGPNRVWVAEEWAPAGTGYRYAGGYWAAPPRPGAVWIPGHWKRHTNGEYWVPGHWRH